MPEYRRNIWKEICEAFAYGHEIHGIHSTVRLSSREFTASFM